MSVGEKYYEVILSRDQTSNYFASSIGTPPPFRARIRKHDFAINTWLVRHQQIETFWFDSGVAQSSATRWTELSVLEVFQPAFGRRDDECRSFRTTSSCDNFQDLFLESETRIKKLNNTKARHETDVT